MDLLAPYFEKYYEVLPSIVCKRDRQYSETFMSMLSPAFLARQEDLKGFEAMLESTAAKEHSFFASFLKRNIETISMVQSARKLCAEYESK